MIGTLPRVLSQEPHCQTPPPPSFGGLPRPPPPRKPIFPSPLAKNKARAQEEEEEEEEEEVGQKRKQPQAPALASHFATWSGKPGQGRLSHWPVRLVSLIVLSIIARMRNRALRSNAVPFHPTPTTIWLGSRVAATSLMAEDHGSSQFVALLPFYLFPHTKA